MQIFFLQIRQTLMPEPGARHGPGKVRGVAGWIVDETGHLRLQHARHAQRRDQDEYRRPLAPFETAPVAAPGDDGEQEMIAVG